MADFFVKIMLTNAPLPYIYVGKLAMLPNSLNVFVQYMFSAVKIKLTTAELYVKINIISKHLQLILSVYCLLS